MSMEERSTQVAGHERTCVFGGMLLTKSSLTHFCGRAISVAVQKKLAVVRLLTKDIPAERRGINMGEETYLFRCSTGVSGCLNPYLVLEKSIGE